MKEITVNVPLTEAEIEFLEILTDNPENKLELRSITFKTIAARNILERKKKEEKENENM